MKRKNIITALALTIAIGLGGTAYAATTANTVQQRVGMGAVTATRGYDYMTKVLKDKTGLTDEQIAEGRKAGKTVYDLAKEKGVSEVDFKVALTEERSKAIDEAVSKGTITKEVGEAMKESLKNNMENCTGTCSQAGMQGQGMDRGQGQGKGQGKGQGGMMGNGQKAMNCPVVNGTSNTQ